MILDTLGLRIANNKKSYLHGLGLKLGISYVFGAWGYVLIVAASWLPKWIDVCCFAWAVTRGSGGSRVLVLTGLLQHLMGAP